MNEIQCCFTDVPHLQLGLVTIQTYYFVPLFLVSASTSDTHKVNTYGWNIIWSCQFVRFLSTCWKFILLKLLNQRWLSYTCVPKKSHFVQRLAERSPLVHLEHTNLLDLLWTFLPSSLDLLALLSTFGLESVFEPSLLHTTSALLLRVEIKCKSTNRSKESV